ncbi:MAG: methyltransferase domain-containing protein [Bacillota bacterium]
MPMYEWTADMVRFMRDASEQNGYHAALAARIAAHLPKNAHVCDAGCGLGYLSLALAPYARRVTAVDIAPHALCVLEENIGRKGLANIRAICGDIAACPPEKPYDAMIFCFFSSVKEALRLAKAQCGGPVIFVKRDWAGHRVSPQAADIRHTVAQAETELAAYNIPFRTERFTLCMDQPLRSLEDAAAFFRAYGKGAPELAQQELKARLIMRENGEFPYYYPMENRLGMLVLNAGELPAYQ